MQQLHLVGLTTDLDSLICSARKGAKSGSFVLPLNEHLLQVIAEAVSRRNADGIEIEVPDALSPAATTPRRQSHLSPREIQDRLRAGRSLEDIASEAGVGEEWVGRFAAPVEAERSQVVGRARRLTYYRPRRGDSGEPLGMAVRWNLADKGVRLANDEFDAAWSAYQLAEQAWMVTFTFESRKRMHSAEWEVDLATNELLSRNRMATELGYVEPGRRRRPTASLQPTASRSPARPIPANPLEDEEPAPPPAPKRAKKAPARKTAARKAPARKAPARKAPARKAPARKAPARKTAARKTAARKAPARRSPAKKAASRPVARRTGRGVPPAAAPPPAPVDDRPVPNELGRRRLQLVSGTVPVRPQVRSGARRAQRVDSGVRIAAARSGDVAPAAPIDRRPEPAPPPGETASPEPGLDVSDSGSAAEARRIERRRARAAARQAVPMAVEGDDDDRVVSIRANRASPPTGEAEVVVPHDVPPLRPAQPATQPRKRLFNRNVP